MSRSRITEKGRRKQGRGEGHGPDYSPWIKVGDYPSNVSFGSRFNGLVNGRPTNAMSLWESNLYLALERGELTDIRENYPLSLEETLVLASRLGFRHPVERKTGFPKALTVDYYTDARDEDGRLINKAYDVKQKSHLAFDSVMREITIKEIYFQDHDTLYKVITQRPCDSVLGKNLFLLRRHSRQYLSVEHQREIRRMEKVLFKELANSREPYAHVCLRLDHKYGYCLGTCLSTVYYLVYHRYWMVDLTEEVRPDEGPLKIKSRRAVEG